MKTTKKNKLQKLAESYVTAGPPEGDEFTIYEYMEAVGGDKPMNIKTAQPHLTDMVNKGVLSVRKGRVNGRRGNIYREI